MENQERSLKELTMRIQREDNLNTVVYDDTVGPGNGRHYYEVLRGNPVVEPVAILAQVQFQDGARTDPDAIAGVLETDLLEIVRHRLQCFQAGEFATRENALALTHIEEALLWLSKRVADRKERKVLGTYNK